MHDVKRSGPLGRTVRSVLVIALGAVCLASGAPAQNGTADPPVVAPVPFGPGERLEYKVTLGMFGEVGEGAMEVVGVSQVRGRPSYHLRFDLEGGVLFAKVDDTLQSWLDVSTLVAHRFQQDQKEVTYERHRVLDFYPDERRWVRDGGEDEGDLATDMPLDDVSFLYFARTLPLEVGETYTLHRYFKEDGNPVTLEVLRKETVTVPAGTFRTVVVRPIIQTDGLFGKGGKAEVYFTDDDRRLLVQMKSKVPVLGSLSLYLKSFKQGRKYLPLTPVSDYLDP